MKVEIITPDGQYSLFPPPLSLFLLLSPFPSIQSVYSTTRLLTPSHASVHIWTIYPIKNSISRYSQGILFRYTSTLKGSHYLQIRSTKPPASDGPQLSHRLRSRVVRGAASIQLQITQQRREQIVRLHATCMTLHL